MPIDLPDSASDLVHRSQVDVSRSLKKSDPFQKNHWLSAMVTANANRVFDFYLALQKAIEMSFPDTSKNEFLERWASIYGIPRTPASSSSGNIIATGSAASVIPIGTTYTSSDGLNYQTTAVATITAQSINVTSIVRVGSLVTVTTDVDHGLASNVNVTINGALPGDYNGQKTIVVTDKDKFTYNITGSPTTPATGTITADHVSASVPVESIGFGVDNNKPLDAVLSLQSTIAGVNNDANVDFGEIGGGTDQQSLDDLAKTLIGRIQNPVAHFNVQDIITEAKKIAGVTRVWPLPVTPAIGQVTIYFMRDGDDDPIPSASEVAAVKNQILTIKPANTSDSDVIVSAPTPVIVNFTFTELTPNTVTMQNAIDESLKQFFDEETTVGVNVDEDRYRATITNTVDPQTGDRVLSFQVSTPAGDIAIASDEIATLGTVTHI